MSDHVKKQVRLTTFGFDTRSEEGFRMTFRGPGQGRAVIVDEDSADFGIINMDSVDAAALLETYEMRHPGRSVIKLSVQGGGEGDALYVKKPARIDDMLKAVDHLISELGSSADDKTKLIAEKESVDEGKTTFKVQGAPQAVEFSASVKKKPKVSLFYSPKDYLQGEIHSAVDYSKSRNVAVELWVLVGQENWKKIIFLPRIDKVLTSLTDKELKFYCSSPLMLLDYKMYRRNEKETERLETKVESEERGIAYESFLWKVALCTSQGRLPQGVSVRDTAQLKHWPNLTRLYPVVGSMRIATLMVDQPRSLPVIAKVLKMPAGRVFAFYSAAHAIGIAGEAGNHLPQLAKASVPQKHRDHTLFGRIMKRLKKDNDPDVEVLA